ncbi:alpha/beta fold hydrolase [Streptomyces sp. NPDC057486]|uniref:alpha/beta fold hydrolase n=1 Tax=Streptomyces sp. NPDC057486 TaxID=3346145 RepID=UPI0036A1436E
MELPALVVVGQQVVICGPRWGLELNELSTDSRLLVLENSGYFGHIEEPMLFAKAVGDFVLGTATRQERAA